MVRSSLADLFPAHRLGPLVCLLGAVVAVGPLAAVPSPGEGGPITLAVRTMQAAVLAVGAAVAGTGVYTYRTGDRRPALAAAGVVAGLALVFGVGALVELRTGAFVPVPVWVLTTALAVVVPALLAYRCVGDGRPVEPP